jgi:hypothetical protein
LIFKTDEEDECEDQKDAVQNEAEEAQADKGFL